MEGTIRVTGNAEADDLVSSDPMALIIAMLLDQQVPLGWAFIGPARLRERLGSLDGRRIAEMDPETLVEIACRPPAIHRFPAVMARRIHEVCSRIVDEYDGDPERVWAGVSDAFELHGRLMALPGFGDEKAKILIAVLGKRFGVRPAGWESASAPFSDRHPRSAADIDGPEARTAVREWKRRQRAAGKSKQD